MHLDYRRLDALTHRAAILQTIRTFFTGQGFLEVETPLRIPAPAPEAHIDAITSEDWFLQTSPELCMKRLLAAGMPKIFQISRCWRRGERGRRHFPEFTMLEWYEKHADYNDLMTTCENLIRTLVPGGVIRCGGHVVKIEAGFEYLSVRESFLRYSNISMEDAVKEDLFDEIMVTDIEPRLGVERPTFLYDYPADRGALARLKEADPTVAERFELYIAGIELANGFSELTDVREQKARFEAEEGFRRLHGYTPYPSPEKFLNDLEMMPPAAGIALGIDRLIMVLLNRDAVDDVVAFTPEEL